MDNPKLAALSEPLEVALDDPSRTPAEPGQPIYPVDRSFIVEIHRDTTFADSGCIGRAEHIASGAVKRFADTSDLLQFLAAAVLGAPPKESADTCANACGAADSTAAGRS